MLSDVSEPVAPETNKADPSPARVAYYACFLRSGGVVSMDQWKALPEGELRALADAAGQVEGERAARIAASLAKILLRPAPDPLVEAAKKALREVSQ